MAPVVHRLGREVVKLYSAGRGGRRPRAQGRPRASPRPKRSARVLARKPPALGRRRLSRAGADVDPKTNPVFSNTTLLEEDSRPVPALRDFLAAKRSRLG